MKSSTVNSLEVRFWQQQAARKPRRCSRDHARAMARALTAEWNRGKRRG